MIWLLFICFTTFHLVANHRAVSVVAMETLNKNRLHLVMSHYLSTRDVLPVKLVNAREPILTSKVCMFMVQIIFVVLMEIFLYKIQDQLECCLMTLVVLFQESLLSKQTFIMS